MTNPKEKVEGESGLEYKEEEVPDPERGGTTTAVVPPERDVYNRPSEGE